MLKVFRLAIVMAAIVMAAIVIVLPRAGVAEVLIKPEEATLPPAKGAVASSTRGITRGPRIDFVAPGNPARSPFPLKVNFRSFGGSKIALATVRVTYLKSPVVDLTGRLKSFLSAEGIDMPSAEAPPGEHAIRIELEDSEGRAGSLGAVLKIAP